MQPPSLYLSFSLSYSFSLQSSYSSRHCLSLSLLQYQLPIALYGFSFLLFSLALFPTPEIFPSFRFCVCFSYSFFISSPSWIGILRSYKSNEFSSYPITSRKVHVSYCCWLYQWSETKHKRAEKEKFRNVYSALRWVLFFFPASAPALFLSLQSKNKFLFVNTEVSFWKAWDRKTLQGRWIWPSWDLWERNHH